MYQAVDISLTIRGKKLLEHVNIALEPEKFTAVVGPNGAGKSTMLKVMANEHSTYEGAVLLNGKNIEKYKAKDLSMVRAVLPQSTNVQFAFTVSQIIALGRHAHGSSQRENQSIVDEVMSVTGVEAFADRQYLSLSGGEKQRVQLARVFAQVWQETMYPRYILLDEPTSSLDITQQQNIFSLARKACERNIGVMAVVHDLNQAVQYADHLYFMRDGKVVTSGDAKKVFTKANIEETFCCRVNVYHDSCNHCPYFIPEKEPATHQSVTRKLTIN
jgi:iron complex transport system ATP-binding protein